MGKHIILAQPILTGKNNQNRAAFLEYSLEEKRTPLSHLPVNIMILERKKVRR